MNGSAGASIGGEAGSDASLADEAWRAIEGPAPSPRLCCDIPAYDQVPLVSDQLKVSGWAIAQAGDAEPVVHIEVAGRGTFRAHYGKDRMAVARSTTGATRTGHRTGDGWSTPSGAR